MHKTSINQAYLQWLTFAGFQTGILIVKWSKSKKGVINLKPLQNPVNHDDTDGQPYLTISYTVPGFPQYISDWMRWIPAKEHGRQYNYGDFRLILFIQRCLQIAKSITKVFMHAQRIRSMNTYKYKRIRQEYFDVCGEYAFRHEIELISANFAHKTKKNNRS
jgi:hypothetical protein